MSQLLQTALVSQFEGVKSYLLEKIHQVGPDATMGNTSLIRDIKHTFKLSLDEAKHIYFAARNQLIEEGFIIRGMGRGGSIKVVSTLQPLGPEIPKEKPAKAPAIKESDLYPGLLAAILGDWAADQNYQQYEAEITANQGRKHTGGKWTRPDITFAGLKTYPYIPGRHLDIVTFEVKTLPEITVIGIYEALAHLRNATKAYVIYYIPELEMSAKKYDLESIVDEAKKHNIGVYVVSGDPASLDSWDEKVEARASKDVDLESLNDFISTQLPMKMKEKIASWR